MLRKWGRAGVLLLVLAVLTWAGADSSSVLAEMKPSNRAQTWEFTLPIRYFGGKTIDFDHGSNIDIHDDLSWGFGFGYNLNEHMNLDFEFAWLNANYKVEWASSSPPGPTTIGSRPNAWRMRSHIGSVSGGTTLAMMPALMSREMGLEE